jgi:cyanophycin synthetase
MRILERNVYVGPSLYAHFPVIRLLLDLGPLEDWPTGGWARLRRRAWSRAARPAEHGCSYREPGGFIRRMREDEGTWLGHVLEHVAIELQNIAGEDVTFGKTRSVDGRPASTPWSTSTRSATKGIEAGELALRCCARCCRPSCARRAACPRAGTGPRRATSSSATRSAARWAVHRQLVKAAEERNIPWLRLNEQSLIQLGHGKYQQRIQATVTGRTSTSRWSWPGQGRDQQDPRQRSACRCRAGAGAQRRARRARRRAAGLPGGDQALQRQPRPRHQHRA